MRMKNQPRVVRTLVERALWVSMQFGQYNNRNAFESCGTFTCCDVCARKCYSLHNKASSNSVLSGGFLCVLDM